MTENPDKLELKKPLLYLGLFILVVAVFISIFNYASLVRRDEVYNQYQAETNQYISNNRQGLEKIFKDIIPNKKCEQSSSCHLINADDLAKLAPNQGLKD